MDNERELPHDHSESIPHLILEALPLTMRVLSAQMRDTQHGLTTTHMPVLAALAMRPRTQSELADMMSVSGATMSNTLTALEERGWIERVRSREDRRQVHVHLSATGKVALHESIAEMEQYLVRLFAGLDEAQRVRLIDGLTVLRDVFYYALGGHSAI
ncbi:MAG: MarR family transcriptional regulator [Chloroflexota bacterium]|nr:MarR family transcriptional regulator [Chloroflexota bacterium]